MTSLIEKVALAIGHQPDCPVYNRRDEPPYVEPGPCDCGAEVKAADALKISHHEELVEALKYLIAECGDDMDDDYNPHAAPLSRARALLAKVGDLS